MAVFTIKELCEATGGACWQQGKAEQCGGISTDTRTVERGQAFIALSGETFDGHAFLAQAAAQGAAVLIVEKQQTTYPADCWVIGVTDTLKALQALARYHRRRFAIPVIAITGSNGKTTTKDMTAAVLGSRWRVLKTQGNFNNEIGLPLTLLKLEKEHDAAVVEMGMRGLGQIRELAEIAEPTLGIVTNVGETHMELLGSLERIAEAKGELVAALPAGSTAILNADNTYVQAMAAKTQAQPCFYGITRGDVRGMNIAMRDTEVQFTCQLADQTFTVTIPTVGMHNVSNALAAIAAGHTLGLTPAEIQQGLTQFQGSGMRLHVEKIAAYSFINDAYNASPMSMTAAVETLCDIAPGRTIAVLGDMLELGDIAETAHRRIGSLLAEKQVNAVFTVGTLAAYIVDNARQAGMATAHACPSHQVAYQLLQQYLEPGDTILVKGSRGMKMETIIEMFRG